MLMQGLEVLCCNLGTERQRSHQQEARPVGWLFKREKV